MLYHTRLLIIVRMAGQSIGMEMIKDLRANDDVGLGVMRNKWLTARLVLL